MPKPKRFQSRPARWSERALFAAGVAALAIAIIAPPAVTHASPESWEILPERFESTGGGGWIIDEYRPVVAGQNCVTDFVAISPDGKERFLNTVTFTATAFAGGVLCTDGRWRARDGSAEGTTPLRVFIKDGVARRAPEG